MRRKFSIWTWSIIHCHNLLYSVCQPVTMNSYEIHKIVTEEAITGYLDERETIPI